MRRTQAMAAVVGLLGGLLLLAAPSVSAQTGYPPGVCSALTGTRDVGTVAIGQRFILQLAPVCIFTPGAALTVTVNGVNIPGKVATAGGFVNVDVTVLSATQLSIEDPVLTPAVCGSNRATAAGPSTVAGGAAVTETATFTVNCPAVATTGTAGPATPITGRLSLTGVNSLRWAATALALMVVGSLFVVAARRRAASRA